MSDTSTINPSPQNNNLFRYFNGFEQVYGDPFEIDSRFAKAAITEDLELLDSWLTEVPRDEEGNLLIDKITRPQEQLYLEACSRYIPLVRAAMEIKPFNKKTGEGLTGEDVLLTWMSYRSWRNDVKKNIETLLDSATPTDSSPSSSRGSTEPRTPESSPERPVMGSTSTSAGVTRGRSAPRSSRPSSS